MHCAGSPSSSSGARRGEEKRAKGKWKRRKKRRGRKWEKRAPANKRNCLSLSLFFSLLSIRAFFAYIYSREDRPICQHFYNNNSERKKGAGEAHFHGKVMGTQLRC